MEGRFPVSTATPSASTRTLISPGTSASSMDVEAVHLPSVQWLNTTLRCPGCRVTLSVDPRPRASGMFRRVGPTPQSWTLYGLMSRVLAARPPREPWSSPRFVGPLDVFVGREWRLQEAAIEVGHVAERPAYSSPNATNRVQLGSRIGTGTNCSLCGVTSLIHTCIVHEHGRA
jgi:hypothetical protein